MRKETPPPGLERYCALTVVSRKSPWVVSAPKKAVFIFATLRFIMCLPCIMTAARCALLVPVSQVEPPVTWQSQ